MAVGADASLRVFRPAPPTGAALLWIHGGGFLIGTGAQDDGLCRTLSEELQVVVAAVEYGSARSMQVRAPAGALRP